MPPFKLKSTLGRSYNADLTDTRRAKEALRKTGHFQTPDYGLTDYPDEPLFQAIEAFQSENDLRRDGIMKPDGETATALREHLIGISKAPKPEDTVVAAAPVAVLPFAPWFAGLLGIGVTTAMSVYNTYLSSSDKSQIRQLHESGEDFEDECDRILYEIDSPTCRGIERKRGKRAAARCWQSAHERHAACIAGRPMPPLDVWNN